jgi:YHS domain-containing protein
MLAPLLRAHPAAARVPGWTRGSPKAKERATMRPDEQPTDMTRMTPQPGSQHTGATAIDPVCGETIDVATAQFTTNYDDGSPTWTTYYFTSDECKQLFERNPEQYVKAAQ